jgi:histidinol-phosphate aminotransferase
VNASSIAKAPERRRLALVGGPIRLDLLPNPHGPSMYVQDALASAEDLHLQDSRSEQRLRERLAQLHSLPAEWFVLTNGADEAVMMSMLAQREWGPVVLFSPTDPAEMRLARFAATEVIETPRSNRFTVDIEPHTQQFAPPASMAIVQSPNDPTGTLLAAPDAVRLMRRYRALVVDERHGEYSGRSLLPLVREFDNIAVIQSFETWAGLAGIPFAYIVARPALGRQIEAYRAAPRVSSAAIVAAHATLDDLAYVRATARRVRDEKSHLFRMLRKLNMLQPLQSWANFLLTQIERGTAEEIQQGLAARDIFVYRPLDPRLDRHLRIAAGTPETTRLLKEALIDMSRELG